MSENREIEELPWDYYAFAGTVEFEFTVEVNGVTAKNKCRYNYKLTPDRRYFDPKHKREIEGRGSMTWSAEFLDEEGVWKTLNSGIFVESKLTPETGTFDTIGDLDELLMSMCEKDAERQEKAARAAHIKAVGAIQ